MLSLSKAYIALAVLAVGCSLASAFSPYSGSITSQQHRAAQRPSLGVATTFAATVDANAEDDDVVNNQQQECGVLVLDHLNINHEKGRQDALKAFYFDFLGCAIDPRKYENYVAGTKVCHVLYRIILSLYVRVI